ncbi:hypothetical protein CPB84DRAFT_1656811, partial [Gymnopilus junonius]
FYVYYGFIQLFFITVRSAINAVAGQLMWIDNRDAPGGPFVYYSTISGKWYGVCVTACAAISFAMTDGLLLYRCYIIYNANWRIVVLPCILYFGEIVMGILVPVEIGVSHTSFFAKPSTNFSIAWISLTCTLTTTMTGLIIGRILYVAYETRLATDYTGVISMLVESAAPLSVAGIAFAVCVAKGSLGFVPLADVWGALAVFSPQLIILRAAMGRAWSENTANE